jgi:hypothetical protein
MKRSTPEATGDRSGGLAFGAPIEASGTHAKRLTGHIIIMPGGLVLVDERLTLTLGKVASGPIECKNGRD